MIGSIGLFICGVGLAFSVSVALDTMTENKELKDKIKYLEDKQKLIDDVDKLYQKIEDNHV